jgi:hypothetical protein
MIWPHLRSLQSTVVTTCITFFNIKKTMYFAKNVYFWILHDFRNKELPSSFLVRQGVR